VSETLQRECEEPGLSGGLLETSGAEKFTKCGYHFSMHLASDYIHPAPRGGKCRIRIYLSEDKQSKGFSARLFGA
jgi:hypothetical protein